MSELTQESLARMIPETEANGWHQDPDGDWAYPEDESPGWLFWVSGSCLTLDWGSLTMLAECGDDIPGTARRLLLAAAAFEGSNPKPADALLVKDLCGELHVTVQVRAFNIMVEAGIRNLGDLRQYGRQRLRELKHCGPRTMAALGHLLSMHGLEMEP